MSHTLADLSSYFPSGDNNPLFLHHHHRLPYDFASSSSTESESDDDDFTELTRGFTRSVSLQERLKTPFPVQKKKVFSVSPESTLNLNFAHADEGAWDLLYASRMNKNILNDAVFMNRGVLGAPHPTGPPLSHHNRNCTFFRSVNETLIREQQLRQKLSATVAAAANHGGGGGQFVAGTGRPVPFGHSAWSPVESHRRQQRSFGGCNRGTAVAKKSCAGTGVFLPRNYNNTPPDQTPAACPVPARMVVQFQSFNKNPQPNINGVFSRQHQLAAEMIMTRRQQAVMLAQQRRSDVTHDVVVPEVVLPQEWTY